MQKRIVDLVKVLVEERNKTSHSKHIKNWDSYTLFNLALAGNLTYDEIMMERNKLLKDESKQFEAAF